MEGSFEWIRVLNHAGVFLDGEKTVLIDPFGIDAPDRPADIICITHGHYDHCSEEDILRCADSHTDITAPLDAVKDDLPGTWHTVEPGNIYTVQGIRIETVPAYNTNKEFHPKENNWVGYIITLKGTRVYHAGDTDRIPEMKDIQADVALLPVSGTYVMTADEAAAAFRDIGAAHGIPMHYGGGVVGTEADAARFLKSIGQK